MNDSGEHPAGYKPVVMRFDQMIHKDMIDGLSGENLTRIPENTTDLIMIDTSSSMSKDDKIGIARKMCLPLMSPTVARKVTEETTGGTRIYECAMAALRMLNEASVNGATVILMTDGEENFSDEAGRKELAKELMALGIRMNLIFTGTEEEADRSQWLEFARDHERVQGFHFKPSSPPEHYYAAAKQLPSYRKPVFRNVSGTVVATVKRTIVIGPVMDPIIDGVPPEAPAILAADAAWEKGQKEEELSVHKEQEPAELRADIENAAKQKDAYGIKPVMTSVLVFLQMAQNAGVPYPPYILTGRHSPEGIQDKYKKPCNRCLSALSSLGILKKAGKTKEGDEVTIRSIVDDTIKTIKVPKDCTRYEVPPKVSQRAIKALLDDERLCSPVEELYKKKLDAEVDGSRPRKKAATA